jgi:hypothetical protein
MKLSPSSDLENHLFYLKLFDIQLQHISQKLLQNGNCKSKLMDYN